MPECAIAQSVSGLKEHFPIRVGNGDLMAFDWISKSTPVGVKKAEALCLAANTETVRIWSGRIEGPYVEFFA